MAIVRLASMRKKNRLRIIFFVFNRTRLRTSIESLLDIPSSLSSIEILRRICDQCSMTDIEYFDPVLCDGVKIQKKNRFSFLFL